MGRDGTEILLGDVNAENLRRQKSFVERNSQRPQGGNDFDDDRRGERKR